MAAADPTYPAFPIACSVATVMMILVLLTSFVRQSWNLGVTFLCIWLCLGNFINVVDAVAWSDNADIKLYVWCDITSRLNIAMNVGMNVAPLLITRRLYLIANFQSVNLPSKRARRLNQVIEWSLGLVWPLVSGGPLYYVLEAARFQVLESLGCTNAMANSIFTFVLGQIWTLLPPLISVIFYYPKVAYIFYRRSRDVNRFLRSGSSVSRTSYLHILALASVDILLTFPLGLVSFALQLREGNLGSLPFYPGWEAVHAPADWPPIGVSFTDLMSGGVFETLNIYWIGWTTPALALGVFSLFGLTTEARTSYWRAIRAVGRLFGWKPSSDTQSSALGLGTLEFGERPMEEISRGSGLREHSSPLSSSHNGPSQLQEATSKTLAALSRSPNQGKAGDTSSVSSASDKA